MKRKKKVNPKDGRKKERRTKKMKQIETIDDDTFEFF